MTSSSNYNFSLYGPNQKWPDSQTIILLKQLDKDFFPTPWSDTSWTESHKSLGNYALMILENDQIIIGFCLFQLIQAEKLGHLLKFLIPTDKRGMGHGNNLLSHSIQQLNLLGFEQFYLEVELSNQSAISCYQKQGFKSLNILKNFYGVGRNGQSMSCIVA
jgi:ribosomal protein S18 acetylase RimI-like enzyme